MQAHVVFPHPYGPNNIYYSIDHYEQRIECICDYMINEVEQRYIEDLLNIDLRLGIRTLEEVKLLDSGKHYIKWSYIEVGDLDWT